jgi:hypothetical protein
MADHPLGADDVRSSRPVGAGQGPLWERRKRQAKAHVILEAKDLSEFRNAAGGIITDGENWTAPAEASSNE